MAQPHFGIYEQTNGVNGEEYDLTSWIKEIDITHEDIDKDGSGRDPETGEMIRNKIGDAHTLDIKFKRLNATQVRKIYLLTHMNYYTARYLNPCINRLRDEDMYTSSVNLGAQRYNRTTGDVYYDGVSFKAIRRYANGSMTRNPIDDDLPEEES